MKLDQWINELETHSTKRDIVTMLVGNKIDKVICWSVLVGRCTIVGTVMKQPIQREHCSFLRELMDEERISLQY